MQWFGVKQLAVACVWASILSNGGCHGTSQNDTEALANLLKIGELISRAASKSTKLRPAFILFGDSITELGADVATQGWTARLSQSYVRSVDVINRGLSGYNTADFTKIVLPAISDELVIQYKPVLLTLWLGTNDAVRLEGPNRRQHVAVDQYATNVVTIVNQFKTLAPEAKVLVITPGVIDDIARLRAYGGGPVDRTNEQSRIYAAACANAVKDIAGVSVLDLYTYMMTTYPDAATRATLLSDGVHLSGLGNQVVYEQIQQRVQALVPAAVLQTPQFPLAV